MTESDARSDVESNIFADFSFVWYYNSNNLQIPLISYVNKQQAKASELEMEANGRVNCVYPPQETRVDTSSTGTEECHVAFQEQQQEDYFVE